MITDELVERVAVAISGAPFPSKASLTKARAALSASGLEALQARVKVLEGALEEIGRRTGLLIHQNTGRWNMTVEHDKRTFDVLSTNQKIVAQALKQESSDAK